MIINRAYKFRIYPNLKQQKQLQLEFAASKKVYNYYLEYSIKKYKKDKVSTNYYDWCKDLTLLKKRDDFLWLGSASSPVLQNSLKDLDTAFRNFYRRVKSGEKSPGFPRFKKFNSSVRYSNISCRYSPENHKVWFSKVGFIKVKDYKTAFGKLMNMTVSESKSGKWFCSICVEQDIEIKDNFSENIIGIDMGIKSFLTDSDGNKIDNTKFYINSQTKRARLARKFSNKNIGSNNRRKSRIRLAKFEEKIASQRDDFLNQVSTQLVRNNKIIFHEDLNISGMIKNRKLSKHIQDSSWGEFFRKLNYKGLWNNCKIIKIDKFSPSSKLCSNCGYKNTELKLKDREWVCSNCGCFLDRDINAAKNILQMGLDKISKV